MRTVNIKGKEYVEVNELLKEFRNNFKDYSLTTEIIELTPEYCVLKAVITDDKGVIRATGLAQETRESSYINKTSYVENCETSAWGRALGNFGIGIDSAICSADELIIALDAQSQEKKEKPEKTEFEKQATAEKTARTKALKQGKETPQPKGSLEERYAKAIAYLEQHSAPYTNSVIDSLNNLVSDLYASDKVEEGTTLNALINDRQGLNDIIVPEFD